MSRRVYDPHRGLVPAIDLSHSTPGDDIHDVLTAIAMLLAIVIIIAFLYLVAA